MDPQDVISTMILCLIYFVLYSGEYCENVVHYCSEFNPCVNGAECIDLDTDYRYIIVKNCLKYSMELFIKNIFSICFSFCITLIYDNEKCAEIYLAHQTGKADNVFICSL